MPPVPFAFGGSVPVEAWQVTVFRPERHLVEVTGRVHVDAPAQQLGFNVQLHRMRHALLQEPQTHLADVRLAEEAGADAATNQVADHPGHR